MCKRKSSTRVTLAVAASLLWLGPPALAQEPWKTPLAASRQADSVTVAASVDYRAGAFYQWLVGSSNRVLWGTPIRVPVLNLETYAGGLRLTKTGGGLQTKSLRFESADGAEYVFRLSDKTVNTMPEVLRHTVLEHVLQDQVSAMHPAAAVMTAPLAAASGVLHPTAVLMVLPDDSMLGESRAEFAGRLGMLERFPNVPTKGAGFGGATSIIDSDSLLRRLNHDASEQVNAREFLAARLLDFLINDNDRHPGNWKWARRGDRPDEPWVPIARDRDHAFVSFGGVIMRMSRWWSPLLVEMNDTPNVAALTAPGLIDARLLAGLDRFVWDSVVSALQTRITDAVVHDAALAMPVEYRAGAPRLEATLRKRRDALAAAASQFYRLLAARVQVQGTDAADHLMVTRESEAFVTVRLASQGRPSFSRRFDARDTREILVYLHGGDDTALVTGRVPNSILVRIIGGNGTNRLLDSSTVAGETHPTHLYDAGRISGISYGPDTMFNRRPYETEGGVLVPHQPDNGSSLRPRVGLSEHRGLGLTPSVQFVRYRYGFDRRPYATMVKVGAEYAMRFGGARLSMAVDQRREASPLHFLAFGQVSDIQMINFNGMGNATIDSGSRSALTAIHQRQSTFRPAIALALGSKWDVSLGPVIQYSNTDAARSPYVAATAAYGIGRFSQAGAQLETRFEWRSLPDKAEHTHHQVLLVFDGTVTPAMLDVRSAYSAVGVTMGTSVTLPIPLQPLFVVRAGSRKLFGDFPFYEAATIGGGGTTRYMDPQRYAGDAAVYATSELRIPLAHFNFLLPIRMGALGLAEAGRVYDDGRSPGGWHTRVGAGVWFGRGYASPVVTLASTTEPGHRGPSLRFGLNF
ncbi:MAG: hypothetical protein IPP90_05580 [Gemmatimonadaceae bacterium]|nr:hypothetical protein [Gemmatimonadaceae bacterium]